MNGVTPLAESVWRRLDEQGHMWVKEGQQYFPYPHDIQRLIDDGQNILDMQSGSATYFKGGVFMYRWENGKIDVYVIEGEL